MLIAACALLTDIDRFPWKSQTEFCVQDQRISSKAGALSVVPHFSLFPPRVAFSRVGWFSRALAFRSLYYPWWRYEFYVAKTISHSFASLTREILFLPLEHKIHIFSPPCNILYLLLTFKAIHKLAPTYISELVSQKDTGGRYYLRSYNGKLLNIPPCQSLSTLGDRSFYMAAPKLWNDLPLFIRNISSVNAFKRALETHLFQKAFSS